MSAGYADIGTGPIQLTEIERLLDIRAKLVETEEGINALAALGMDIPPEAIELRTIMRRAIAAEYAATKSHVNEDAGEYIALRSQL